MSSVKNIPDRSGAHTSTCPDVTNNIQQSVIRVSLRIYTGQRVLFTLASVNPLKFNTPTLTLYSNSP